MRKLIFFTVAAVLVVATLGSPVASAQTTITLGGGSSTVVFSSTGGPTVNMSFGTISTTGFGNGVLSGNIAAFTITQPVGSFTLSDLGGGRWSVTPPAGMVTFSWGGFLTGNLSLISFAQTAGSGAGNFNDLMQVELNVTGGSLSGVFGNFGILTFTVNLPGGATTNISTLKSVSPGSSLTFNFTSGAVDPTPEPGSMLLLGTGLVAVGAFLRRRWLT